VASNDLFVNLATDYEPRSEFSAIKTALFPAEGGSALHSSRTHVFPDTDTSTLFLGDFFPVPAGTYLLQVGLVDENDTRSTADDHLIALYSGEVEVADRISEASVEILRPLRNVTKDFLLIDMDDDDQVSPGDTLRYQIDIPGPMESGVFVDLPQSATLLAGSVVTSHGEVLFGNGPGARAIKVDLGAVGEGETAFIDYAAEVTPVIESQGTFTVGRDVFPTDDPDTPEPGDPTTTLVVGTGVAPCRTRVAELESGIAAYLDDHDEDGVVAARDVCGTTMAGAIVDDLGCSQAEFCGFIDVTTGLGRAACNNADWHNDEPLVDPEDCKARRGACLAR